VSASPWSAVLGAALLSACMVEDTVATLHRPDSGVDLPDAWVRHCADSGPPLLLGDPASGPQVCSGQLAQALFRRAACSCEGVSFSAPFTVDAFRSTSGPYAPGGTGGGDVGVNGVLSANDRGTVGGALQVGGLQLNRALSVGGTLASNGPVGGPGASASVTGDARVNGDVTFSTMTVGGVLTVPPEFSPGTAQASEVRREPVATVVPCGCDAATRFDPAALIAHHTGDNDNAAIGLDAAALEDVTGERVLELPCGRFLLSRIAGPGHATLRIRGRTALFVPGGVDLVEALTVDVRPPGELDLFLAGGFLVSGQLSLGSPTLPSRVRVYVAGTQPLDISAGSTLAGNLYAPQAQLNLSGNAEVFGALFVRHLEASGAVRVHHDAAVLEAGEACPQG
jgi:cytoskeletal protein CcmA (bactofilin family)